MEQGISASLKDQAMLEMVTVANFKESLIMLRQFK